MDIGKNAVKLGEFDIATLATGVRSLTEGRWCADASRQQVFHAHHSTQTIKLIADADFRHEKPTTHEEYDRFELALAPLMAYVRAYHAQTLRQRKLIDTHGLGYFIRVILTRLPAGTEIRPHIDEGYSLKRSHRIHVPIISNSETTFRVGDLTLHMRAGEMWEINNRRIHAVRNDGSEARIHLIMDYVQPGETVFDAEGLLTA